MHGVLDCVKWLSSFRSRHSPQPRTWPSSMVTFVVSGLGHRQTYFAPLVLSLGLLEAMRPLEAVAILPPAAIGHQRIEVTARWWNVHTRSCKYTGFTPRRICCPPDAAPHLPMWGRSGGRKEYSIKRSMSGLSVMRSIGSTHRTLPHHQARDDRKLFEVPQNIDGAMSHEIPEKQWAQVIEKTGGPVDYKQIPVAKPGPDEVLVNIKYSGVCHTDLHAVNGDWPLATKLPLVGGHEGAGVVVAKGELVTDVEIGDHAGIKVCIQSSQDRQTLTVFQQWLNGSCLTCDFCQTGDEPLCQKALLSGYTVDGTFQQYAIGKAAHVARIPKDVPLDAIAPVLCAGITVYKGLKESGARPGQTVAVVGAGGGLGSLACQYAKAMGLRVIAIDAGDEKKKMTKELGAEAFVDFSTSQNVVKDVQAATADGLGPHAVLLVAVNEKPFQQAAEVCGSRWQVCVIEL